MASDKDTSKFISLILRHKPETIGITLDEHGWANVDELVAGVNKSHPLDMEDLERIVAEDDKQRYSFNEDKTLIRANQGHSVPVDVELEEVEPPRILYHGTGEKYTSSIEKEGLIPKSRLYVHLSSDEETARKVGIRHGKPVIYVVKAERMYKKGYKFYRSVNGVWLINDVPLKYLKRISFDDKEIEKIIADVDSVLLRRELDDDSIDCPSRAETIFEELQKKYGWEKLQQAIIRILLDDRRSLDDYCEMADVIWIAALEKGEGAPIRFRKKTILGLLYYRLEGRDFTGMHNDYENLLWSIACKLFHLDYCNSTYAPLKDEKIIRKLGKYGIHI